MKPKLTPVKEGNQRTDIRNGQRIDKGEPPTKSNLNEAKLLVKMVQTVCLCIDAAPIVFSSIQSFSRIFDPERESFRRIDIGEVFVRQGAVEQLRIWAHHDLSPFSSSSALFPVF